MSGTVTAPPYAAFSGAALSAQEMEDIREFCGYPLLGNGTVIFPEWWNNPHYLALEARMVTAQPAELQNMRYKLSVIYPLDAAIAAASTTLNVAQASVFTRNPKEMQERRRLFDYYRRRLCQFMGVPPGPGLSDDGATREIIV